MIVVLPIKFVSLNRILRFIHLFCTWLIFKLLNASTCYSIVSHTQKNVLHNNEDRRQEFKHVSLEYKFARSPDFSSYFFIRNAFFFNNKSLWSSNFWEITSSEGFQFNVSSSILFLIAKNSIKEWLQSVLIWEKNKDLTLNWNFVCMSALVYKLLAWTPKFQFCGWLQFLITTKLSKNV